MLLNPWDCDGKTRRTRTLATARRAAIPAAAACLCLATASCSSNSGKPAAPSGASADRTLTVAALPLTDDAPLYLAQSEGLFAKAGIKLVVKPLAQSTLAVPALANGSVDVIAGANNVSMLSAQANGTAQLKLLVDGAHCTAANFELLANPASGISSLAGLAGRSVAVNTPKNIQQLALGMQLKAAGLAPSSVSYLTVTFADMQGLLNVGRVNAISVVEPFASEDRAAGDRVVTSQCTGPTAGLSLSGYWATASFTQENPQLAHDFQSIMDQAQATADADPAALVKILPGYTTISPAAAAKIAFDEYPTTTTAGPLQTVADAMLAQGFIGKQINASSLLFP